MKKLLGNLRLAVKLGVGFGICLLLSIIVGVSSIMGMNKMDAARPMPMPAPVMSATLPLSLDPMAVVSVSYRDPENAAGCSTRSRCEAAPDGRWRGVLILFKCARSDG